MNYQPAPEGKDEQLWQLARKRAAFKRHLATYIIVNLFLWILWYFTGSYKTSQGLPWPAWTTLGWGIGLAFHFASAYLNTGNNSIQKEYDKLTENKNKL